MPFLKATFPDSASEQTKLYNSSGSLVQSANYSPSGGTAWAMIGLVMADAFDPDSDASTLVAALVALSGITSIPNTDSGKRGFYGQMPSTIEAADHEGRLLCEVITSSEVGFASNRFNRQEPLHRYITPPVGKKWVIVNCVLPSAFVNDTVVTDLETAIEGVTGITTAKVLLYSAVPATATDALVRVTSRMRIDRVPEP